MDLLKFGEVDDNIRSNVFPQPFRKITTMQFGKLYPSFLKEVIPGQTVQVRSSKFMRMLPMLAPIMTNAVVREDFYYVPNRILWQNWKKFITGVTTEVPIEHPKIAIDTQYKNSNITTRQTLWSYLGIPNSYIWVPEYQETFNALPFAAYNAIYNQYYRNEFLEDELLMEVVDGDVQNSALVIQWNNDPLLKNWKRDYFFGSTPTPQYGLSVLLPLTTTEDVDVYLRTYAQINGTTYDPDLGTRWKDINDSIVGGDVLETVSSTGQTILSTSGRPQKYDPYGSLGVNVNQNAATIDSLRNAIALQKFLERDLTGGVKYIDNIYAHFGVVVPDYTAQVPVYLGSVTQGFDITEVVSKVETQVGDSLQPLGSLAGYGYSAGSGDTIYCNVKEHGFIMSIISIVPELVYPDTGLHKLWLREERTDYADPAFAELGMQPVFKNELWYRGSDYKEVVWGYRPIYDEYKHSQSIASGDITDTLDYWANYIKFNSSIALNKDNAKVDQRLYDLDRIFSIDTNGPSEVIIDYIYIDTHYDYVTKLPLPRFNIPNIS